MAHGYLSELWRNGEVQKLIKEKIRRLPFQRVRKDPGREARTGTQDATTEAAHREKAPDNQ